jgi:DNA invertase Pin-like site-specific DNA recombinase
MLKTFAYLRVSGKAQVKGDGFPRQQEAIKHYAKSNDIRIIDVFKEEGICGATELENRPWRCLKLLKPTERSSS